MFIWFRIRTQQANRDLVVKHYLSTRYIILCNLSRALMWIRIRHWSAPFFDPVPTRGFYCPVLHWALAYVAFNDYNPSANAPQRILSHLYVRTIHHREVRHALVYWTTLRIHSPMDCPALWILTHRECFWRRPARRMTYGQSIYWPWTSILITRIWIPGHQEQLHFTISFNLRRHTRLLAWWSIRRPGKRNGQIPQARPVNNRR